MISGAAAPAPGDTLEPFSLRERSGEAYHWTPGRVTMICAFAYWCDTWKTQRERVKTALGRMRGQPIDALAVSVDGRWTKLEPNPDWGRALVDPQSRWSKALHLDRVPYTLIVDETGVVRYATYGISRSDDLVRELGNAFQPVEGGDLYLTFDDFPSSRLNGELLDALQREKLPATLFVIGQNAVRDPYWVKRASAEGAGLAVHAWKHEKENPEPERARAWLSEVTGQAPNWYRLPGSNQVTNFDGEPMAGRVVDPYDFKYPGPVEIRRRVFSRLAPGAIIQLHAGVPETIEFLPDLAAKARSLGYRFVLLP